MNFETGYLNVKEQSFQKAKKIISALIVAGIVTFGPGVEGFKSITAPSSPDKYITYVEKQSGADEVKAEMMRGKLKFLEEKFSPHVTDYLMKADAAAKENSKNMPEKPVIAGFEKAGIDEKDLGELWSKKHYPVGAIEGNVSSVKYLGTQTKNVSDYNIAGQAAASAEDFTDSIAFHDDGIKVETKKDLLDRIESLDWHFSHELGHNVDWVNQNKLDPADRAEFLHDVAQAFEKPGSFRDPMGYINSINNPDKQKENYYKVREYWATLCEEYLSFPELAKDYFSKDELVLVKKWLEREDKNFDPVKAEQGRKVLMENMAEKGMGSLK
jgi:hypothetical protein